VPNGEISVDVYLNKKKIIDRSNTSARFTVTPNEPGQLLFRRYVGNTEMDKFTVNVALIPAPQVDKPDFKDGEDVAIVRTTSYGMVGDKKNVAVLKVEIGNAEEPELVKTTTDESGMEHTSTWRIKRRDNKSPFEFSIYAIDQRGSREGKSVVRSYSSN
jgi:hypothetical protein